MICVPPAAEPRWLRVPDPARFGGHHQHLAQGHCPGHPGDGRQSLGPPGLVGEEMAGHYAGELIFHGEK